MPKHSKKYGKKIALTAAMFGFILIMLNLIQSIKKSHLKSIKPRKSASISLTNNQFMATLEDISKKLDVLIKVQAYWINKNNRVENRLSDGFVIYC